MSPDVSPRRRRRILLGLGAAALLLAAAVVVFVLTHGPGNVSNPNVEFQAGEAPAATPPKRAVKREKDFVWPIYGYSADRRRQVSVPHALRPPFRRKWFFNGGVLLEFPPVISGKSLYLLKDDGVVEALDKRTGKVRWKRKVGRLAAASPAVEGDRLYLTVLVRKGASGGRALALNARNGKVLWSRPLPARTESSPVVANRTVYFGSENGVVYALRERDGGVRWSFRAAGPVKGGLALKDGRLFFGDYAGKLYAIRASNGKQVWQASTQGARFGFAAGRFYATPAVAYGRVYIGNVDSYVYSFSARTGELAWRTKTNGYVYSSPAVGAAPGDRPTVYAGSYDGTFYALDARSGAVRWRYGGGSKISGGATLLGDIVYFSDLGKRHTIGLGARSGRKVFDFPRGGYNPVVTDLKTLYLIGYGAIYALVPKSAGKARQPAGRPQRAQGRPPRRGKLPESFRQLIARQRAAERRR